MTKYKYIDLTYLIDENTFNYIIKKKDCEFNVLCDYNQYSTKTKFKVHTLDISAGSGTHIDPAAHCCKGLATINNCIKEFILMLLLLMSLKMYLRK